eukprot:12974491-Ditylum_brightwellii.AAC.1
MLWKWIMVKNRLEMMRERKKNVTSPQKSASATMMYLATTKTCIARKKAMTPLAILRVVSTWR